MINPPYFDAVLMLTWSDWKTEPRSNRYHYATRFSRTLPVLFFQHRYQKINGIQVEPTDVENLDLVHVSCGLSQFDALEVRKLLSGRGIRRPLLWIYDSLNYQLLLDALPRSFRVYHATEDYLTDSIALGVDRDVISKSVVRLLTQIDFMVACSNSVANSYLTAGGYKGRYAVVENGCDAEFFLELAAENAAGPSSKSNIAIFQGGINQRLDYDLLLEITRLLPDWEFHFCGNAVISPGWSAVLHQDNVRYLGVLSPEEFGRCMCSATVGIIPYIQDQWIRNSLPLKAFEYIACGLPVVTVPITALEREAELIAVATNAKEFAEAIRRGADLRENPELLQKRREAALVNSYNNKFAFMCNDLNAARESINKVGRKLRIALLYDSGSTHIETIREHLQAFGAYSKHSISYIPATASFWAYSSSRSIGEIDFSVFDVAVVHYSIRLSIPNHFDEGVAESLQKFCGLKILFIQDEYECTECARAWMDRLSFDVVYTCVPEVGLEYVYPSYRFPATEFLPTLTGYVPENSSLDRYAKPLSDRKLLIAYRGRRLPAIYGTLGYDKYRIGAEMKRHAKDRGLDVDIELDDSKRIYGTAWYEFLGSARATLGTESGANIFDFDGSLKREIESLTRENPGITFDEIYSKVLAPHERHVRMNQISPKIFEAILMRTALVLFEGTYSGVVQPDIHYIPLKKDFSNIEEVLSKLKDDGYLEDMTARAYKDIVASGKYSYRHFVEKFDTDVAERVLHNCSADILVAPLLFVTRDGKLRQALPVLPCGIHIGQNSQAYPMSLSDAANVIDLQLMCRPRHTLSVVPRIRLLSYCGTMAKAIRSRLIHSPLLFKMARSIWHWLPETTRARLNRFIDLS